jgi:hypothetical protein
MPNHFSTATHQLLNKPFAMSSGDDSGCPVALLEQARRHDRLRLLEEIDDHQVLIEFPVATLLREQVSCRRFVRLRNNDYALVI